MALKRTEVVNEFAEFGQGEQLFDHKVESAVKTYVAIKQQLEHIKEQFKLAQEQLINLFDHPEPNGQKSFSKTYHSGAYGIELRSEMKYKVNKDQYKKIKHLIPKNLDPIKKTVKYDIDPKTYERFEEYVMSLQGEDLTKEQAELRDILLSFTTKEPGSTAVKVKI